MNRVVRRLFAMVAALTLTVVCTPRHSSAAFAANPLRPALTCALYETGQFNCDVFTSGVSGSITSYSWSGINVSFKTNSSIYNSNSGTCHVGTIAIARVVVKDDQGNVGADNAYFYCR